MYRLISTVRGSEAKEIKRLTNEDISKAFNKMWNLGKNSGPKEVKTSELPTKNIKGLFIDGNLRLIELNFNTISLYQKIN